MRRTSLLAAAAPLALVLPCAAQSSVGTPFCFGSACPCGNDDPGRGCGNHGLDGDRASGAELAGSGSPDVFADDLVLTATGIAPDSYGVVLMGDAASPTPAGDGLLCVGGGPGGLWRFAPALVGDSGELVQTSVVSHSQSFGGGAIQAGDTWSFQTWYRDAGGPCGTGANFSNGLSVTFVAPGSQAPVRERLAGRPLASYPHFEKVRSVNQGDDLFVAIDPARLPWLVGTSGELYVVAARDRAQWEQDATLLDVRGAAQPWSIVAGDVAANTLLVDAGTLNGTQGDAVGVGYDLVYDHDTDGLLGPGDVIDGLSDVAGVYIVRDTVASGPHAVVEVLHNGGSWLLEDIYYPADIAGLGQVPLVVVSHGNGHNYTWYDHIGFHLASYGYVVMSHSNDTGPGIESAAGTTLSNTDYFLGSLDVIDGGTLLGHVDPMRIAWIGHSRGGEGITRAYDLVFDGDYVPVNFTLESIRLISSIAPTVFFPKAKSHPHKANYHLWVGSADADVDGGPDSPVVQSFTLLERANGKKAAIVLQGMGHAVFHDGGGSWVASGPCQNGPGKTHTIMRGYLLPLVEFFVRGDPASEDFLWRPWETFKPIGKPSDETCIVVSYEYHEAADDVITVDDFQSEADPYRSSSGAAVRWTVRDLTEGRLDDQDNTFVWSAADPMNGMTRAGHAADDAAGVVFSWDGPGALEFDLPGAERNLADDDFLSFRACQGTRHPLTSAVLEDTTFSVSLIDEAGGSSTIPIAALGNGVVEPYQRMSGWANEFETVRLRLTDFLAEGSGLDLARVKTIRFDFGGPGDSPFGRLGMDDVKIEKAPEEGQP